jgi:hypothetical protein
MRPSRPCATAASHAIAGVDEVGRGALFGPVVAAAVILPERLGALARAGLKDSKQLTREQREKLDRRIRKCALAISVAEVDAETIDRVNIYQATRIAMLAAVAGTGTLQPDHLLIDAMRLDHPCAADAPLLWRRALALHRCGVGHRQGASRPPDARAGRRAPRLWPRFAQRLRHAGAPPHAVRTRPLCPAPPQLRTGPRPYYRRAGSHRPNFRPHLLLGDPVLDDPCSTTGSSWQQLRIEWPALKKSGAEAL